jgi:DNA-directed RNA polymerase specialized sigma24 family protein
MGAADDHERTLVAAVRRGSTEAVTALFEAHWRGLWRAAFVILSDESAAEDVAQEAFLAALAGLDRYDERRPFGAWAKRIAVNRALDELRSRRRRADRERVFESTWKEELGEDLGRSSSSVSSAGFPSCCTTCSGIASMRSPNSSACRRAPLARG